MRVAVTCRYDRINTVNPLCRPRFVCTYVGKIISKVKKLWTLKSYCSGNGNDGECGTGVTLTGRCRFVR
jgi:hypothetical protein